MKFLVRDLEIAAREEASLGGGWVKFIGDSGHRDHPGEEADIGWTVDELRPAVEAARSLGARIAMHVTTPAAVDLAIALDIDSIEHGSHLKPTHLKQMAQRAAPGLRHSQHFASFSSAFVRGNCEFPSNRSPKQSRQSNVSSLLQLQTA